MIGFILDRVATLANGDRVPLWQAAHQYAIVKGYLESPDSEWNLVYYLRQLCLGREVEPEQRAALAREALIGEDGRVDPVLNAVMLSAVRGEERLLHLDSPFVDVQDRLITEFLVARDELPREVLAAIAAEDPGRAITEAVNDTPVPPDAGMLPDKIRDILRRKTEEPNPPPEGPDGKAR
jgi:hypothetical protein